MVPGMKNFELGDHTFDFATRTHPLTYDELWEWCRRAPYYTIHNGLDRLLLVPRGHPSYESVAVASDDNARLFPLMVARAVSVALRLEI